MSEFSKGPWILTELFAALPRDQEEDDVVMAANISNPLSGEIDEVAWSNARLFAAAPDLLEALKWLYANVERLALPGDLKTACEVAIAKAEGRSATE